MLVVGMFEVVVYQGRNGTEPFTEWHANLDPQASARIDTAVRRIAEGNLGDAKGVGSGVLERRIEWGPGYRIYFGRDGERLIVLLGGGTKKRQQKDIERAQGCWLDYKRRR